MSPTPAEATPHAFPFRLVERVERCGDGRAVVVLASANDTLTKLGEWPCTLVAEALAQAILLMVQGRVATPRLVGLNRVRLARPVLAGDRLEIEVGSGRSFGALRRFECRALSEGALAATAEVTVAGDKEDDGTWR